MNEALINYLFRNNNSRKTDQSSLLKNSVKKNLEEKLINEELVFNTESNESLSLHEYLIESRLESINLLLNNIEKNSKELDSKVSSRLEDLKLKIINTEKNVKEALLSERKLTGETYTLNIPLLKEYSSKNTSAEIKNEIIFGSGYIESKDDTENLSTINIVSEEETEFQISSKKTDYPININFEKNTYKAFNQISIKIEDKAKTGILYLKFNKAEAISILDEKGYEIIKPKISKEISLPIDNEKKSFSIRFLNNNKRSVIIEKLYLSNNIYNNNTVYETLPLKIEKDLSYLTVQTCDNYSNKEVSIVYYISINGSSYRVIRPNGKISISGNLESIIRATDLSDYIEIETSGLEDNQYRFINTSIDTLNSDYFIFSKKFGKDFFSFENYIKNNDEFYTMNISSKKEKSIKLSPNMSITINDIYYTYNSQNKGEVIIPKGLSSIKIRKNYWKEIIDLDLYRVTDVNKNSITVVDRSTEKIITVNNYFDTEEEVNNSLYLQFFKNNFDIYLKKENLKLKKGRNGEYSFFKEDNSSLYIYSNSLITTVKSIQIKAEMKSLSGKVCPFISRILVRGV